MSFSITGGAIAQGSMVGTQCTTDWITIPCATNTNDPEMQTGSPSVCVDRICGMVFNSATTIAGSPSVAVMSESECQWGWANEIGRTRMTEQFVTRFLPAIIHK